MSTERAEEVEQLRTVNVSVSSNVIKALWKDKRGYFNRASVPGDVCDSLL